ncbi:MAG: MaoC/PaaZ C-terminal domain-containing protein [Pseudomonadota bacterium]
MNSMYFEDFEIGQKFTTLSRTITEKDIKDFVELTGLYSPLFLDEEVAKKSIHKGKIAPGPLTFSFAMGLFTQLGIFEDTVMAFLGMDGMKLSMPAKPGDTIRVEIEIIEKRETKKEDRGVVKEKYRVMNQRDETIMTYEMAHLTKKRS